MIVSFANVFAALVEFAVVNYTSMREKERKESKPSKNTKNKYTVVGKFHIYSHTAPSQHNGSIRVQWY